MRKLCFSKFSWNIANYTIFSNILATFQPFPFYFLLEQAKTCKFTFFRAEVWRSKSNKFAHLFALSYTNQINKVWGICREFSLAFEFEFKWAWKKSIFRSINYFAPLVCYGQNSFKHTQPVDVFNMTKSSLEVFWHKKTEKHTQKNQLFLDGIRIEKYLHLIKLKNIRVLIKCILNLYWWVGAIWRVE